VFILTCLGLICGCSPGLFQQETPETAESAERVQEAPAYWTTALEDRREQLLAEGMTPVAESNAGLYKAAIAREIVKRAPEGVEVEESKSLVLIRLSAELAFETGSADLSDQAAKQLEVYAQVFRDYALSLLEISGHTDNTGSAQINHQLSEQRARSVAELLQSSGVDPLRMVVEGRSDTQPLADNASSEGRRMNRRVEIRVIPLLAGHGPIPAVSGQK